MQLNQLPPPLERRRVVVRRQQLKRLENCTHRGDSSLAMKSILVSIVAAVLMVGCGSSIHQAAMSGNTEAVKQHLTEGVDVNAKDGVGRTPLHEAATYGDEEVAELLIANDADVNAKDNAGTTPLDWASGKMADLLRKHGGKTGEELKAEGK